MEIFEKLIFGDDLFLHVLGLTTLLISFVGFIVAIKQYVFYKNNPNKLSRHLSRVFLSDGLIYIATALFGIFSYVGVQGNDFTFLYFLRIIILVFNIWASWELYKHYKNVR